MSLSVSIWHLLLLFIQYVVLPFWARFSWCVASFVLVCGTSFWSCISHFLHFAVRVFSVCVLLRISCSLSRFLFTFVDAYVFFPATSFSIENFLLYFFVCFVYVLQLNTIFFLAYFLGPFCFLVFYSLGILSAVKTSFAGIVHQLRGCMAHLRGTNKTCII